MNEFIKRVTVLIIQPKILIILGFVGIGLIVLPSFFPEKNTEHSDTKKEYADTESYRYDLQDEVCRIVKSITGDEKCTVVITLESGVRYTYADTNEEDNSSTSGQNHEETSRSSAKSYITVKTADGGEEPLIVSEIMPQVRGVAVVCSGGDDKVIKEKITGALTAALDITSKRVYVSGGK